MASYNFYDNEDLPLWNRFSSISDVAEQNEESDRTLQRSLDLWRNTFNYNAAPPLEDAMRTLLNNLRALGTMVPRTTCPKYRLFVSHRRIDKDYALRIANVAHNNGFEFWLDVLDLTLATVPMLKHLSSMQQALLTACIIEMGLINSTHILAVMTKDTKGGEWVPYEYGRVRDVDNTGCWYHPHHTFTLPEYMLLGEITGSEFEIEQWLLKVYSSSRPCSPIHWKWPPTISLP